MTVFYDNNDIAHAVLTTYSRDHQYGPEYVLTTASTWCQLARRFKRGEALLYDEPPTCFVCIALEARAPR